MIDKIKQLGDNLKLLQGHDRLQYLVDKAKEVEPLPDEVKIEQNRILQNMTHIVNCHG